MKNRYLLWICFFIALTAAANGIKHVLRWHSGYALTFMLIKDLVLAAAVVYLYRLARSSEDMKVTTLSVRVIAVLLIIGVAADYTVVLLRG